ncbi:MAG TPA: hypothetical protein VMD31_12585 [Opitutaceae bacterium]|nr:hypothetical protein [Opitutaceae bacterium]
MGLFDRFLPKSPAPRPPAAAAPAPAPAAEEVPAAPEPIPPMPEAPAPAPTGVAVLSRLKQAREELERKNPAAAMAIYEEVLAAAGDRPDVLMTISGDLGVTGHTREMIELVAPRYDAERHGPATGFNLLQAYLAVREPQAAQHVLDLLFALNRPELQDRLFGFSNVIADMMLMEAEGTIAPIVPAAVVAADPNVNKIDLVTISKPVWFYGLERLAGLLPLKEGRLRRVAFGQLALPAVKDVEAAMQQPEDELARLSRGIPLWLAETFLFSPHYSTVAVAATAQHDRYAVFNAEWAPEHLRQLVDTTEGGLDYVFIGSLDQKHADYELTLRLWEVKKFRERKVFTVRWTPVTADPTLAEFGAQIRAFMEFAPYPAGQGLAYAAPAALRDYAEALGGALSLFLTEKQVLPAARGVLPAEVVAAADRAAAQTEPAALLALGLRARAARLGLTAPPPPAALAAGPAVADARRELDL